MSETLSFLLSSVFPSLRRQWPSRSPSALSPTQSEEAGVTVLMTELPGVVVVVVTVALCLCFNEPTLRLSFSSSRLWLLKL